MARLDPVHDFLQRSTHPLDAIFNPKSVAVIGAKDDPGSVGRTIMHNLREANPKLLLYPVNPKRDEVLGIQCYQTILAIEEEVDLAVIITPSFTVPKVMQECAHAGVKGVIVISAGFKEVGPCGEKLEKEVVRIAKESGILLIGPNCLGVMNPISGLNATFAKGCAKPGSIAFISQSGAMCTSVLDWSFQEGIGFSSFVSIGSMADVSWGDLIQYYGRDPHTKSILLYMETVGDPKGFLSAAREVSLEKPILVIKGGRTEESQHAAASHTGAIAGSDQVFNAALERCGVLRVNHISELFSMASCLSFQERPKGPNLAIVTNAGGPSVLACDACVLAGAKMAELSETLTEELNTLLPEAWSHGNPVDILGDAKPVTYVEAVDLLATDDAIDGILVVLTPQDVTDPLGTAQNLKPFARIGKPLLTSWMGGEAVQGGIRQLREALIPHFPYPDDAARAFGLMWQYSQNLEKLYETPSWNGLNQEASVYNKAKEEGEKLLSAVQKEGRVLLNEKESKELLSIWGIPQVKTYEVTTVVEAVEIAETIGYPVVLKLLSTTISHKTDVGGVKLNLKTQEEVIAAFHEILAIPGATGVSLQKMINTDGLELILGASMDPQFGPVLLFGTGGSLVEVYQDTALALPPLNTTLARRMLEKTKIYQALLGVRGQASVDMEELERLVVRFSDMVTAHPTLAECDINPLLATQEGFIALDARIVLLPEGQEKTLSIRPYPMEYVWYEQLKTGQTVCFRPIQPSDEELVRAFHEKLSQESVVNRFLEELPVDQRVSHKRLITICFNDYDNDLGLVVVNEEEILGIGRISHIRGTSGAHLKLVVQDKEQGKGIGALLMGKLIEMAKREKITFLEGKTLKDNEAMRVLAKRFGFSLELVGEEFIKIRLSFE